MTARRLFVLVALAFAFVGGSAHATTTFTVDTTSDGPGDCGVAGQCTLRAAVTAANATSGGSVIVLPAGTYTLANGALAPTGALEVDGAGSGATVIDGNGADRVFDAENATSLTLTNLRITNGHFQGGGGIFTVNGPLTLTNVELDHNSASPDGSGGAILANDSVTLTNVSLHDNDAGQGGALYQQGGSLTMVESTVANNTATGNGANSGGIGFRGFNAVIADSTISGNTVTNTDSVPGHGQAGGLLIAAGGRVLLDGSSISGNSATAPLGSFAGGVEFSAPAGGTISNTTIRNNTADQLAGLAMQTAGSIVNSTISDNTATQQIGGMFAFADGTDIRNSTFANNVPLNFETINRIHIAGTLFTIQAGSGNANCSDSASPRPTSVSGGGNVASDGSCDFFGSSDLASVDLQLGALQDNGGPGFTRLPGATSPALGVLAGSDVFGLDERGVLRSGSADSGAVEHGSAPAVGVTVGAPGLVGSGKTFDVAVTVRNRSGGAVTGASVSLSPSSLVLAGGQTASRSIGTLAGGADDVELYTFTAPVNMSCTDDVVPLGLTAAWSGSTQTATFPIRVTAGCGGIQGLVTANGLAVAGGKVDVCPASTGTCTEVVTDANGRYTASVPNGSYTAKAFPTATTPSNASVATAGPATVASPGFTTVDIVLTPVGPPPSNVIVVTPAPPAPSGLVQVAKGSGATITMSSPCGGSAPTGWTISGGGNVLLTGSFTQVGAAPPFSYQATIPPSPPSVSFSGIATFASACGSAPNPTPFPFRWYDPSGTVKDSHGDPVAGATVTLLRSDSPGGPFVQVANGSDTMSPENRRNPDTTLDDGTYSWDVEAGYYQVHAEKDGCTADSAVLQIPPPALGVDLVLSCPPPPPTTTAITTTAATTTTTAPTTTTAETTTATTTATTTSTPAPSSNPTPTAAPASTTVPTTLPPSTAPEKQAPPQVHATLKLHGSAVRGSFSVDEPVIVHLRLLGADGRARALAPGTTLALFRTGKPHTALDAAVPAGTVQLTLRLTGRLHGALQLEVVATNSDGTVTRLVAPVK